MAAGSGRGGAGGGATLSEINVTPFVDVVLVLLIIFMLTAHVMEFGMKVDVPEVRYVQNTTQDMPVVTIDKTGEYVLGHGGVININDLVPQIRGRYAAAKGVYVAADKDTPWDAVAQVVDELGHGKLAVYMVTQPLGFRQEALIMPSHADILDRPDALAKPFWTSLTLHVLVLGLFSGGAVLEHRINMGDPHGGGMGGVLVNPVASIPIPNRGGRVNPVANDTKSQVPTPPPPKEKAKPAVKEKAPLPNAVDIKNDRAPKKTRDAAAQPNKFRDAQKYPANQIYSDIGQRGSSPYNAVQGGGGVRIGDSSPFGEQFGAYANIIRENIARNWNPASFAKSAAAPSVCGDLHHSPRRIHRECEDFEEQRHPNYGLFGYARGRGLSIAAPAAQFSTRSGRSGTEIRTGELI
jgi:biopolymer transport protein ExbD